MKEFLNKLNKKKLVSLLGLGTGIFLYSFMLTAVCELAAHHSLSMVFEFLGLNNVFIAVLNTSILIACLITFISFITTKVSIGVSIVSIITYGFYIADGMKILFRSEPLFTWDLTVATEALTVLDSVGFKFTYAMVAATVFVVLGITAAIIFDVKFAKYIKTRYVFKFIPAFLSVIVFFGAFALLFNNDYIIKHGLDAVSWEQVKSYRENGLLYSMLYNYRSSQVKAPENYSEQTIKDLVSSIDKNEDVNIKNPNIIILMSEAFSDIGACQNATFSKELTPNYNKYASEFLSGNCLTRQFGGGTANSEFEVITGYSASLIPQGTIAYTSYTDAKTPSYVSYLKEQGYYLTASHPYIRTFFSREKAYAQLGFDLYHSEADFGDAKRIRDSEYISDEALTDKIIELYEQNKGSGKPFFNHSVSMQNHSSYWEGEYEKDELITVKTDAEITKEEKAALETYATGINLSDKALGRLLEYFENVEEPTVILFFGDHQPYLSEDTYSLLKKIGYLPQDELLASFGYYSTPYLIWNNFNEKAESKKQDMSMFELLPYMTGELSMNRPDYFYFLDGFASECKGFTDMIYLDKNGAPTTTVDAAMNEKLEQFKLMQYDLLHGKRYANEIYK